MSSRIPPLISAAFIYKLVSHIIAPTFTTRQILLPDIIPKYVCLIPTKHLAFLESQTSSICVFYEVQKRRFEPTLCQMLGWMS